MLDFKKELAIELESKMNLLKLLKRNYRALSRYHNCRLKSRRSGKNGDRRVFSKVVRRGNQYKEKYLGPEDHPEVKLLKQHYYLEQSIKKIEPIVKTLRKLNAQYWEYDPRIAQTAFPRSYQNLPKSSPNLCVKSNFRHNF